MFHNEVGQVPTATGTISYAMQSRGWGAAPAIPVADVIDIGTQNVSDITIYPARATVDCNVQVNVQADGPLLVRFFGCSRVAEQH